jgi:hypothetical protein
MSKQRSDASGGRRFSAASWKEDTRTQSVDFSGTAYASSSGADELEEDLDLAVLSMPTEDEIRNLDMAKNKVNTVFLWILQGVAQEIRVGTLDAPAPLVSRVFQELSNGMVGFNQAHKLALVPFPFPFAQLVSLLLLGLCTALPFYIDLFTRNVFWTPVLSFVLPTCFVGLNWIAIELEEPFGTDYNDVDIEERHEDFLWLLVDVLRQPRTPATTPATVPPTHQDQYALERGIIQRITMQQDQDMLAEELLPYCSPSSAPASPPERSLSGGVSDALDRDNHHAATLFQSSWSI